MTWIAALRPVKNTLKLMADPKVPFKLKLIPIAAIIYALSPLDIIPDVFLGLGQLDDLVLIILAMQLFIGLAGSSRVSRVGKHEQLKAERDFEFEEGEILEEE